MRKRRRLADKLTIMVCAVLVAVSAFFYAPMEVKAEETTVVVNASSSLSVQAVTAVRCPNNAIDIPSLSNLVDGKYYLVNYSGTYKVDTSRAVHRGDCFVNLHLGDLSLAVVSDTSLFLALTTYTYNFSGSFVYKASSSDLFTFDTDMLLGGTEGACNIVNTLNFNVDSVEEIHTGDGDNFNEGYNAGYSAGEQAGYGNGYSQGFADGEASVDTNEIYNQGFNAGKDSVDTQSYYDAGYQAGYQVAYQDGYDSGYDEGYQSAMDRIDGWGADSADYPVLVYSFSDLDGGTFFGGSFGGSSEGVNSYTDLVVSSTFGSDFLINPNHTYKFNVVFDSFQFAYSQNMIVTTSTASFFTVGDLNYLISSSYPYGEFDVNTSFFVPGDFMSNTFGFDFIYYSAVTHGLTMPKVLYDSYYVYVYDMGPSGDTQNHIANQTDSLTNGFNDSHGNSVNNEFSSGLNDFETAEDSLFATATTGLKDFTFFDIQSVPAMVTGMSFVGSIMSGWFTQAGGASGVGIVLSILFSIMLVAMVLGLYRWYQSKGGKD